MNVVSPVNESPLSNAHWIGAAPLYFGKIEPWRLMQPTLGIFSRISGKILNATTTKRSGKRSDNKTEKLSSLRFSEDRTGIPKSSAHFATGVESGFRPLP